MPPHLRDFISRNCGADRVKGRGQINGDDLVPFPDRKLLDQRDELDAGIVHEDVEQSERPFAARNTSAISPALLMSAGE